MKTHPNRQPLHQLRDRLLIPLLVLVLASLACQINLGGPEIPETTIPVSTEAVLSLTDQWKAAADGALDDGLITLVVNESQVTSLVAFRLMEQEDPVLQNPQVYLRNGKIEVYGIASQGSLTGNVRIVLAVALDDSGTPSLSLESADFGPFPVPDGLLDGFSAMLDEAFTGSVGPAATGLRLESIVIDNGLMAITGRIR
jgi:hypothetical protein